MLRPVERARISTRLIKQFRTLRDSCAGLRMTSSKKSFSTQNAIAGPQREYLLTERDFMHIQ